MCLSLRNRKVIGLKRFTTRLILLAVVFSSTSGYWCYPKLDEKRQLGRYYLDLTDFALNWPGSLDQNGIPLREYGAKIGMQYQPVGIAEYALGNHDLYLESHDDRYKEIFLKQANWFCNNLVTKRINRNCIFGVWEYKFDFASHRQKAPWVSAMSQGEGISVLLRAYQLTDGQKYLKCAKLALKSFEVSSKKGGVRYEDDKGFVWYEEYPADTPPHVLNGFIFALFGLYDFYQVTDDGKALNLFSQGIQTLEANLHLYDLGFWSSYDLPAYDTGTKLENVLFHFVTDKYHPGNTHPIDKIRLVTITSNYDILSKTLEVGAPNDTRDASVNYSQLCYSPDYQDWGESYILDGRTTRNYENVGGKWGHGPFYFRITVEPNLRYYLEVVYKDVSTEPVYVEVFRGRYVRIGELDKENDQKWKITKIEVPHKLLAVRHGASRRYHVWHIEQLQIVHRITGKKVFLEFAEKFVSYLNKH